MQATGSARGSGPCGVRATGVVPPNAVAILVLTAGVLASAPGPGWARGLWQCNAPDGSITELTSSPKAGWNCRAFDERPSVRAITGARKCRSTWVGRTLVSRCLADGIEVVSVTNVGPQERAGGGPDRRPATPASSGGDATAPAAEPPERDGRASGDAGRREIEQIIVRAASASGIPEALLRAVITVESGFRPDAVSAAGAEGLMQLMPVTSRSLDVTDPFDPEQNVMAGARFLRVLSDRFHGDVERTVAAYFAGPTTVARAGGIPSDRAEAYVRAVLTLYRKFAAGPAATAPAP